MNLTPEQHQAMNEFRNVWTLRFGKATIVILLFFGLISLTTMILKWTLS